MISIYADKGKGEISVSGHGRDNPTGPSIVCAAISTLVATLAESLWEIAMDPFEETTDDGEIVRIRYDPTREISQNLASFFILGCELVEMKHPTQIELTIVID